VRVSEKERVLVGVWFSGQQLCEYGKKSAKFLTDDKKNI